MEGELEAHAEGLEPLDGRQRVLDQDGAEFGGAAAVGDAVQVRGEGGGRVGVDGDAGGGRGVGWRVVDEWEERGEAGVRGAVGAGCEVRVAAGPVGGTCVVLVGWWRCWWELRCRSVQYCGRLGH